MSTKNKILKLLNKKKIITGKELSEFLGISRQAVNKHLKDLIEKGGLVKEGVTRGAIYKLPHPKEKARSLRKFGKTYSLEGREEDIVFQEVATLLNLHRELSSYASDIVRYSFTEIFNNAIDHSRSEKCTVEAQTDPFRCNYRIRDFGVGIFYSIFTKFDLPDENAAVGELIKGKTTTMKERHSGEGIFFTSKSADIMSFRSHNISLVFDNQRNDVFVEEKKFIKGTEVFFSISKRSRRRLDRIFAQFAPEEFDYRFEKTRVSVDLFHKDYVSRSEAKRMLHGLDKFREVVLDFSGVKSIGQGFADEIFRVFRKAHPNILIKTENINPTLEPVIHHVVDNNIN